MAKRKSKALAALASPSSSKKSRVSTEIEGAENGFIVRVSSDGQGPEGSYTSKRYIAPDHASAIRIASEGMAGMSSKSKGSGKKKGGKRKVVSTKKV